MAGRAAVLGALALTAGAVSHAAAGGLVPGPLPMLLLFVVATAVAARFLRHPASTSRIVLLLVAGQGLVHLALSGLAGHRGDLPDRIGPSAASDPWSAAVIGAEGRREGSLLTQWEATRATAGAGDSPAGAPFGHLLGHLTDQGLPMVLAHLAAAAALGLWLAVGERALWRLLHLAATRVAVALARSRAHGAGAAALAGTLRRAAPMRSDVADRRPPLERLTGRRVTRRGPPLILAS